MAVINYTAIYNVITDVFLYIRLRQSDLVLDKS